jgi:hypothetical protein
VTEDETTLPVEDYVTTVGVIATTHAIPGRPVRLSLEALESAREQLLAGVVPMQIEHDARQRLQPTITDAKVLQGDDGEFRLTVTTVMSASDYQRLGGRTAYSVAFPEVGVPGWPSPLSPIIVVMADSYHWNDAAILEALEVFLDAPFEIEGARYHQLAGEPPAKIVFDLLVNYRDISPAILAAYAVECIKTLFRRRRQRSVGEGQAETGELSSDADESGGQPVETEAAGKDSHALASSQTVPSNEILIDASFPALARVTLEFRSDARLATVDCSGTESSERLVEMVIRALAEVTPISDDQEDTSPSE